MNLGLGNQKQTIMAGVLGVLAVGACIYIYVELFGGSSAPAPAPVAVSAPVTPQSSPVAATPQAEVVAPRVAGAPAAKNVGTTSATLDPTLHMDAMLVSESVEYSGIGRNIFSANSAPPVVIPVPIAKPRQVVAAPPPPPPLPCPPNCPLPPPPPPIDLKFFGVATTAQGTRKAFLLHDDNVYLASAGDIVMRRYKVVAIDAKTIQIEDMQNNNTQSLPLLTN